MKIASALWVALTLVGLSGCSQGTPGGPGTTDATGKTAGYGQADDTFNLSVPFLATSLQQGEQMEATIGIKRAQNFEQDVVLELTELPTGVTARPAKPVIRHGDTDAKITFQAEDEAPLGEFKVKVTGHPTNGSDAQIEFKLTIAAKDSFQLSVPRQVTLKQGESQTLAIDITRDKSFDQEIALTFGHLPKGVTLDADPAVIKRGEGKVQFTLAAANDAALGNFDVKVTGHPANGADALVELQLTVVKE